MVRRALYVEEGADRSGGRCIVRRAPTGQGSAEREDVADRSGGRCMVRRAPTGQEGTVQCTVMRAPTDLEGAVR